MELPEPEKAELELKMSEDKAKMNSLLKEDSMLKMKEKEAAKQ
jgi:hypothetical protein